MSDDIRRAEIEERLSKATPGPWRWRNTSRNEVTLLGDRTACVMAFERLGMQGAQPAFRRNDGLLYPAAKENLYGFPDADLIANAPADLRWLLDRLAEVERERDNWRRVAADQTRLERDRAERAEAALARARALESQPVETTTCAKVVNLDPAISWANGYSAAIENLLVALDGSES